MGTRQLVAPTRELAARLDPKAVAERRKRAGSTADSRRSAVDERSRGQVQADTLVECGTFLLDRRASCGAGATRRSAQCGVTYLVKVLHPWSGCTKRPLMPSCDAVLPR